MTLWRRILGRTQEEGEVDQRIKQAEEKLADLERRANRVVPSLERRKRRNHWAETVEMLWEGR
ncbi:DUF7620 family protein [Nocardioides massiliensis]|uniref:Uncharacterized protein n=1 Tax=Nocardioides massiliensis TaxID=1325935 RepID=A0ABT9NIZ5_9ACTN|nr:hypothetical protein [Nocardioides massiliensis]MDP9820374.1 hypothetical protein [Nocardioides massiliensis]